MTMIVADADVAANDNAAGINSSPAPPETAPPETAAATATTTGKKCAPPKKDGRRDDDNDDENARQLHRQLQQLVVIDKFPYIVSSSERQHPPSTSARTPTTAGASDDDEDDDDAPATNSSGATRNGSGGHRGTDDDDDGGGGGQISFLVEIAKATIPKRRRRGGARGDGDRGDRGGNNGSKSGSSRKVLGMHCTAHWVGPVNPSGRRRRERPLHRTRTLRITETDVSGGGGVVGPSSEAAVVSRSDSVYSGASPLAGGGGGSGKEMAVDCTEHVFTVNDASLFLFRTTMKQLVNASLGGPRSAAAAAMADDDDDDDGGVGDDERDDERDDDARAASSSSSSSPCVVDGGGLRFDVFERPLDVLNSVYTTILADYSMSEQEASAMTDGEKKSSSSSSSSSSPLFNNAYRLVGSVFLTPHDILSRCDETRFECEMMENWRGMQRQQQRSGGGPRGGGGGGGGGGGASMTSMTTPKRVDGARLALRIRVASEFDVAFMRSIEEFYDEEDAAKGVNATLRSALMRARNATHLEPAQLVTEIDENVLTAENTVMKLVNLTPAAMESVRYMMSNDVERRVMVKPHPDPSRPPEETMWMTEDELRSECRGPSTNWIQAGWSDRPDSLGRVYLEVLQCRGLPNTDAGGSVGNKTDPFVSVVYGDVMVQTEVINDSLSPMWMPWSSRAFVFQLSHPSAAVHVSVVDYDFGPLDHEAIGRCSIRIGTRFHPGTVYTLSYKLYDSPNLMEKGEVMGTITVRLRVEINDEKRYLMEGYRPPEQRFVNSQQKKTHRIARYTVDGPHDEEVFEMNLFRSHINELLTQKRYMMYAIYDASRSLIFWRGQVKVGNVWLPLHSAVLFFSLTHVVETPHLLPSFVLFGCGWILLANMLLRVSHPNPWHRGHSFAHYWNIMVHGKSSHATNKRGVRIKPLQGHEEASRLMEKWEQRLADEDADYAKQLDLDAKIKTITDGANVRTRTKAKSAIADPISALAGARLLPYQQRLSGYCNKMRYVRNVLTWNESIVSFFLTLSFFGAAFVALFVPWRFLLLWTSRLVVWIFLGPWMRLADLFFHEETVRQKAKASNKAMELFHQQHVMAKMLRENALKVNSSLLVSIIPRVIYIIRLKNHPLLLHLTDEGIQGKVIRQIHNQRTGVQSHAARRRAATRIVRRAVPIGGGS